MSVMLALTVVTDLSSNTLENMEEGVEMGN
jgi:hypothetical protein